MTAEDIAPQVILFDMDGTLVDTFDLYVEAYRRTLSPHLGYAPTVDDILARSPSSERHFLAHWVAAENLGQRWDELQRHYRDLHGALCGGLYEGVREVLQALRAAGIPIGIVTGKSRASLDVTLAAYDLGTFDVTVTDDDVTHPKPDPSGLIAAVSALNIDPREAIYVGDSTADMEAGRAAGVRIGAALWPKTASGERERFVEETRRWHPDWLLDRPADVTRLFAKWC